MRTPLSIKVAALLLMLGAIPPVRGVVAMAGRPHGVQLVELVPLLVVAAAIGYLAICLWRMSRVPFLVYASLTSLSFAWRVTKHFPWRAKYPALGMFVVIIPLALMSALVLPNWKLMSWNPIGRGVLPAPFKPEEVF
ncbi:MAG TPA: hypothetical protein VGI79_13470 [Caulobacteraceae bacterium]|jgi:hypothetical protein